MSYTGKGYSDSSTTGAVEGSSHLKLYQAFIFSVPIFFAFVLLLFFYIFYLRRRRVDWSSLRMRSPQLQHTATGADELSRVCIRKIKERSDFYINLGIVVLIDFFCCCCCNSVNWGWRRRWGRCYQLLCSQRASQLKTHSKSPLSFLILWIVYMLRIW